MFTASHRGGAGSPLVCLHGFTDTWRTWELMLPALERSHDVLALALPGHAGGPSLDGDVSVDAVLDALEASLDAHGIERAHLLGNSLGAYLAFRLAERGRALTVVAFAPAGGWADGDPAMGDVLDRQTAMIAELRAAGPAIAFTAGRRSGRRMATRFIVENADHLTEDFVAHLLHGVAACEAGPRMIAAARDSDWPLSPAEVTCPVRIVWGTADQLLAWPSAAARYQEAFPHADWVVLDGVGHAIQLDVPLEAAQLVLGWTG